MEHRELPEGIRFISGVGDIAEKTACIMSAVAWIAGEPWGDAPACACPVLRRLSIRLNDTDWWESDEERTAALMPLAEKLVGTKAAPAVETERARVAAHRMVTMFAPMALDSAAGALVAKLPEHAEKLRGHAATLRSFPLERFKIAAAAQAANAAYAAAANAAANARAAAAAANAAAANAAANARAAAANARAAAAAANAANAANAQAAAAAANAAYAAYAAAANAAAANAAADADAAAYAADAAAYAADPSRRLAAKLPARAALLALVSELIEVRNG
jgi:chemosensory pili system protein ChpA (sensor histidine kinase/response regulator)